MQLIYGHDEAVARWVVDRVDHMDVPREYAAIGVARDGELIAGVIYHNFIPDYRGLEISMASSSPRWATRRTIRALLSYPFEQLGCRWVLTCTPHKNEAALRVNRALGFVQRGVLPDFYDAKKHAVLMTMPARGYARLFEKAS